MLKDALPFLKYGVHPLVINVINEKFSEKSHKTILDIIGKEAIRCNTISYATENQKQIALLAALMADTLFLNTTDAIIPINL